MFDDFITVSRYFYEENVQHETAVPSIMLLLLTSQAASRGLKNVLDGKKCPTFKSLADARLLDIIDDCWGSCCTERKPTHQDIQTHRCGHRLDLRKTSDLHEVIRRV